jgi:hypothetical protein
MAAVRYQKDFIRTLQVFYPARPQIIFFRRPKVMAHRIKALAAYRPRIEQGIPLPASPKYD